MSVITTTHKNYQVSVTSGSHQFIVDEPAGIGDDMGPDPYTLLLGALGSCTVITLHMYARRKKWPLESVVVALNTYSVHAKDADECESEDGRVHIINRTITFNGPLSEEQSARLLEIADRCPVHKTLEGQIEIETKLGSG